MDQPLDVVVVGGCGHVGLPLALLFTEQKMRVTGFDIDQRKIATLTQSGTYIVRILALSLADCGYKVGIDDIDATKVAFVKAGNVPFLENGADALLKKLLPTGRLELASDPSTVGRTKTVVLVIGTPIDEFMNPSVRIFDKVIDDLAPHLQKGSLIVLRSTVFPGTTESVERRLRSAGVEADVAFCPERIAEGHALEELRTLPQLIGTTSDRAFEKASALFERLGVSVMRTTPLEAELAKLLTNTWRYMKFAIANQFFQIAHRSGVDYNHVLDAIRRDYPRASDLPSPPGPAC